MRTSGQARCTGSTMTISLYDAAQVEELLDYPGCIDAMRTAMIALSSGERPQPLRQIFTVGDDQMFGTMPGELAALSTFGAKLVSVFDDPRSEERRVGKECRSRGWRCYEEEDGS